MIKTAAISSDGGKYRYRLARIWDDKNARRAVFVMLNPSTADASIDDPTIRKCIGFARQWSQQNVERRIGEIGGPDHRFGGIVVVNLFGLRATNPAELMKADDPIGSENDDYIRKEAWAAAAADSLIVCAWGTNKAIELMDRGPGISLPRFAAVRDMLHAYAPNKICRIGDVTKEGNPRHPLYLPYSSVLMPF